MSRPAVPLHAHGDVPADRLAALTRFVADHTTTERMFRALDAQDLRLADIIAMDEYTIDLVVPLPDGLWLVYDTT